jgi:hypothetical protein
VSSPIQFPFVSRGTGGPVPDLAPLLPIQLTRAGITLDVVGLVDSGASVSVLPWSVGLQFGVDWTSLTIPCVVGGSAGGIPGKFLVVNGTVASLPTIQLAFAWVRSDAVPLILGQTNFFLEFDIAFYRHRGIFTVEPHQP